MKVVVVGDVMLDRELLGSVTRIAPDAPVPVVDVADVRQSPGGAALTALLAAADLDVQVTLLAPVADDDGGRLLRQLLGPAVDVVALPHEGPTRRKSRVRAGGQVLMRLDDGGPGGCGDIPDAVVAQTEGLLAGADVVLVSDYGAGVTRQPTLRRLLAAIAPRTPIIWDPHPRGGPPVPGCALVTPNLAEARQALGEAGGSDPAQLAERLRAHWRARAVCVTSGAGGAYCAADGSEVLHLPTTPISGDPCGAGDRFAATVAVAIARTGALSTSLALAVRAATAWVAAGGTSGYFAATPQPLRPGRPVAGEETPAQVAARVRAAGGTLVATGGCFDVLHAGHVGCLQAARALGDALVVLINSDDSVRRLKGPSRPVVGQSDRERVLRALASVDAVAVFAEDDPRQALAGLRPDVWAKGGDYGGAELPEAELVRSWGGRVVLLPYLDGRSTTQILHAGAGQA